MVPIVTGALETISKDIEKWLTEIGVTCRLESLRRACLYWVQPESFVKFWIPRYYKQMFS